MPPLTFLINYKALVLGTPSACKRGTLNPQSDPISYSSSSASSFARAAYNVVPVAEAKALNLFSSLLPIARVQLSSKCSAAPPAYSSASSSVFKVFIYLISLLLFVFCALCLSLSPIFLFDFVCCCYHFSSIYIFVFVSLHTLFTGSK